ncbi:MAG: transporter [Candidatus Accumulibacter sp. 66-26]|nr:TolC family protein [Accumulibacter sp.]OJW50418.1 MAG: transporter [Candidatus Accumulibacter sp. 66-26]
MPLRASRLSLCLASFAGIFSVSAQAFGSADPFATESLVPPRPVLQTGSDAALTVPSPCLAPASGAAIDVLQAVDMALCNNPQTRAVWANARAQAAQVGIAQGAYLPTLDGKLAATRVDNSLSSVSTGQQKSAALTLSWLLFDFGTRAANLESARQLLSAASATLDASVQSLFLSALQAYYNAQATRAALAAAQESEKASRESFVAAESRYKVGTGTPADRLQAQTAWSQATLNRIRAEGDLRNAQGVLANVMGLDANRPLALAELPAGAPEAGSGNGNGESYAAAEQDVAALVAEARRRRPDLQAAEAQLKAAQAGIDAARGAGLPTVVLGAGQTWQDAGGISGNGSSLGLTLNLPLFSGFGTTYKVRAAQAQSESLAAQRDQLSQQISLDVWRAYQSLTTAGQSLKTTADLLASAEQSERVALGRYKAGVGNILDVLNAQSALAAARQQRIQALLDWRVYRATLAQSLGNLDIGLLQAPAAGKSQP